MTLKQLNAKIEKAWSQAGKLSATLEEIRIAAGQLTDQVDGAKPARPPKGKDAEGSNPPAATRGVTKLFAHHASERFPPAIGPG